jgi:hypothetical protein
MLPTKFQFIWPSVSEEKIFFKSANQKQELPVVVMDRDKMSNLYKGPFIDASYQIQKIKIQFIWLRGFKGED